MTQVWLTWIRIKVLSFPPLLTHAAVAKLNAAYFSKAA